MIRKFKWLPLVASLLVSSAALAIVPTTNYQNSYVADGSNSTFAFDWRVINPTQMIVKVNGVTQVGNYTVFQNTNGVGGSISFASPPAGDAVVLIQRNSDLLQLDSLQNNGAIPPKVLEDMIDKLTIEMQQIANLVSSGVTLTSNAGSIAITGNGGNYNLDLANTGVSAGSYTNPNVTVNARGQVTSISNGSGGGGGGGGTTGTVNTGSSGQLAYYAGNGDAVSGLSSLTAAQMLPLASSKVYIGNGSSQPVAQTISGDMTLSSGGVATLKNTGPGAGSFTYPSVTIDNQGRVTAISSNTPPTQVLQLAHVQLTGSQVIGLSGTPITLIAAQGAGTTICVHNTLWVLTPGTTQFSGNLNAVVAYSGGNSITSTVSSSVINSSSGSSTIRTPADVTAAQNTAVVIKSNSGAASAGNGTLDLYVTYSVH